MSEILLDRYGSLPFYHGEPFFRGITTATALWGRATQDSVVPSPAGRRAIEVALLAAMDDAADILNQGETTQGDLVAAVETLRSAIFNAAIETQRSFVDPEYINQGGLHHGSPYTLDAFAKFRDVMREIWQSA